MNHYLFRICVILHQPVEVDDEGLPVTVVGYYRNVAVSAPSEQEAQMIVATSVDSVGLLAGGIDWAASSYEAIDLARFNPKITKHCKHPSHKGIWYMSGRWFFPKEDIPQ
jgi:hypothetical protein